MHTHHIPKGSSATAEELVFYTAKDVSESMAIEYRTLLGWVARGEFTPESRRIPRKKGRPPVVFTDRDIERLELFRRLWFFLEKTEHVHGALYEMERLYQDWDAVEGRPLLAMYLSEQSGPDDPKTSFKVVHGQEEMDGTELALLPVRNFVQHARKAANKMREAIGAVSALPSTGGTACP